MDKIFFMNEAINEAKKAYDKGETPIGAVINYRKRSQFN